MTDKERNFNVYRMIHAMADRLNDRDTRKPSSFISDLIHDGAAVQADPTPFVWMVRDSGTQIARDLDMLNAVVDTWPDQDQIYWVCCAPKDRHSDPGVGTCRKITPDEARELLAAELAFREYQTSPHWAEQRA